MAEKDKSRQLPAPAQKQELATAKKPLTTAEQVEKELQEITTSNFYPVPGRAGGPDRLVPDSRALQHYANKFPGGIATKILDAGVDEAKAWAHIQAWPCSDPLRVSEDKVTLVFAFELQGYIWDYVIKGCKNHRNGCPVVKENGKAVIRDGIPQLEDIGCNFLLRQLMNRKMKFAEREAITKCKSRLYLQIMNMEWRDQEEIENEEKDLSLIAGKDIKPVSAAAAPVATAATTTASPTEAAKQPEAKKEAPKPATAKPNGKTVEPQQPSLVPRAQIPTTPFPPMPGSKEALEADRKTAVEAPQPKAPGQLKKRSERLTDLSNIMSCSGQNVLAFIASSLNCADPNDLTTKPKTEIDAIIVGLEACVQKFQPSAVGFFIKKEPMSQVVSKEIADFLLNIFSIEMKKSEVPANG